MGKPFDLRALVNLHAAGKWGVVGISLLAMWGAGAIGQKELSGQFMLMTNFLVIGFLFIEVIKILYGNNRRR